MKIKAPFIGVESRAGFGFDGKRLYDNMRTVLQARQGRSFGFVTYVGKIYRKYKRASAKQGRP